MISARTKSHDDTLALAASLASVVRPGDVLLLNGELGTGKTVFVKGFAQGLGIHDTVTSPTFTLLRSYDGRLPLVHADAFRMDHPDEAADLGLGELLDEGAVVLVEWGDRVTSWLPNEFLDVRFELGDADDERRLRVRGVGSSWAERASAVRSALEPWCEGR